MSKKTFMTTIIITAFLVFSVAGMQAVPFPSLSKAATEPSIVISKEGITTYSDNVTSHSDAPISQIGSTYFLTDSLENREIWIDASDITLKGNGHTTNRGIYVTNQQNITIQDLTFTCSQSVGFHNVIKALVTNCTLTSGDMPWYELCAVAIDRSASVRIVGNTIRGGDCGILLTGSEDNEIVDNTIMGTSTTWNHPTAGIMIYNSSNNIFYHNNFINNSVNVYLDNVYLEVDNDSHNTWDNGYPSGGNFWGDYLSKNPNASEIGKSGIWSIPYKLNANNTDYNPLTKQVDKTGLTPSPIPISQSTATPTASSTTLSTQSPAASSSVSSSPIEQPTTEPSQTPDRLQVGNFAPVIIPGIMILLGIVAVGLLVHFGQKKGVL